MDITRWLREQELDTLAHLEDEYRSKTGAFEMTAQKQYRNPLEVGDTVRIVGEEYHGQVGELRVIDPDADEEAFFGVYLDSTEAIVPFRFEDLDRVEAEQEKPHPDECLCDECWAFRFAVCGYDD